jgi:phosphoribosylamine--glycine ligase
VVSFCKSNNVGLVMVGPEAPLVAGLVDDLAAAGIRAFGPSAKAAQLEGSKTFMKVGLAGWAGWLGGLGGLAGGTG